MPLLIEKWRKILKIERRYKLVFLINKRDSSLRSE